MKNAKVEAQCPWCNKIQTLKQKRMVAMYSPEGGLQTLRNWKARAEVNNIAVCSACHEPFAIMVTTTQFFLESISNQKQGDKKQ